MELALVVFYRICGLAAGVTMAYFGYRLFREGIYEKAGELVAKWQGKELALRQAAPGTFFAVLGVLLVGVSVWRQLEHSTLHVDGVSVELEEKSEGAVVRVSPEIKELLEALIAQRFVSPDDARALNAFLNDHLRIVKESLTFTANYYVPEIPEDVFYKISTDEELTAEDKVKLSQWYLSVSEAGETPPFVRTCIVNALHDTSTQSEGDALREWARVVTSKPRELDDVMPEDEDASAPPPAPQA